MPRIEIDVDQILISAVSLDVDPGDRLLVMNGVVVGIVDKLGVKQPAAVAVPALAAPAPDTAPHGRVTLPENVILQREILEIIRRKGPLTGREIKANMAHIDEPGRLAGALKVLRTSGAIRATSDERYPAYVFAGNGVRA